MSTVSVGYSGVLPAGASSVTVAQPDPASGQTVLTWKTPITADVSDVELTYDVMSSKASLSPGQHLLEIVATPVGSSGAGTVVAQVDLADLQYAANANPLGQSSGWATLDTDEGDALANLLQAGQQYTIAIRLVENPGTPADEKVAVALGSLDASTKSPWLRVSTSDGSSVLSPFTFGHNKDGSTTIPLQVSNAGTAALTVTSVTLNGTGLAMAGTPALPATLAPGQSVTINVHPVDASKTASGTLQVASNDPLDPAFTATLKYEPQLPVTNPAPGLRDLVYGARLQ